MRIKYKIQSASSNPNPQSKIHNQVQNSKYTFEPKIQSAQLNQNSKPKVQSIQWNQD